MRAGPNPEQPGSRNPSGAATDRAAADVRRRLVDVARALELYAVPAFISDPLNRIVHVNARFATLIGDPNELRLPASLRFIPAAMLGPFRDRFPRREEELVACLPGMEVAVSRGELRREALGLMQDVLGETPGLARRVRDGQPAWDGTVLIGSKRGPLLLREQVVPLALSSGEPSGFHINQWVPVLDERSAVPANAMAGDATTLPLTPRQVEIARLFGAGLTAREVARRSGVAPKTARYHLEEIYRRLDIHSRAELSQRLVRARLL